jgi:hypothetical protein
METTETTHECTIIRVDFVRAGAERQARTVTGGARIIDLGEPRMLAARQALDSLMPAQRQRPRGAPGSFRGPF